MEQKKLSKTSKIILISILILTLILISIICIIIIKIKQDKNIQADKEYVLIAEKEGEMYGSGFSARIEMRFQDNTLHEKIIMTFDSSFYCSITETSLKENEIKISFVGDNKIVLEDIEAEKLGHLNSTIVTENDLREMFETKYTEQEMEDFLIIYEYVLKQKGYKILTKETENLEYKYEKIINDAFKNNGVFDQEYSWKQDIEEDNNSSIDSEDDYLNTPQDFLNVKSYNEWLEEQDRLIDDMEETKKLLDSIKNSN